MLPPISRTIRRSVHSNGVHLQTDGTLKARQLAPGRRTLNAHETKYSAMVLDGSPVDPGDSIVIGVNQAQRVNSDTWWRADLQAAAEARVPLKR
jgi:hypothetical protein